MAPAQVLPNEAASTTVKKQKLLLAGKERLAAYRREKALEKERKAAASRQSQGTSDNQSSEAPPLDRDEVGPSRKGNGFTDDSLRAIPGGSEAVLPVRTNDHVSSNGVQTVPPPRLNKDGSYVQFNTADQETNLDGASGSYNPKADYKISGNNEGTPEESGISDGRKRQHITSEPNYLHKSASHDKNSSLSNVNTYNIFSPHDNNKIFVDAVSSEGPGTTPGERKLGSFLSFVPNPDSAPSENSEPFSLNFLSDRSVLDYALTDIAKTKTTGRKSRPSFLDNIKVSSRTPFPSPVGTKEINSVKSNTPDLSNLSTEQKVVEAFNSSITGSTSGKSSDFPVYSSNESYQLDGIANGNWREYENSYHSTRHNEDFSALEQHIEDLTQEKFSLQRAVEASRTLAESLAAENSALTDSYNQQGSVVNQLKAEMEKLQDEIRGQSVELEALKSEYGNVLLECNAADERAKLLASEVISLEEKALRLRSNELKLERQLENALSEVSSLKKKMAGLERERQDLHASIAAFQEEKLSLQSKLRNFPLTGSRHVNNNPSNKKDASTSTDDIVYEDSAEPAGTVGGLDSHIHRAESSSEINSLRLTHFLENTGDPQLVSSSIPSDHAGVIQNINALLSELALEKEMLIRTLKDEASECSKYKELNKELSKRLEIQTQRLELLTAQNMARQNVSSKQPNFPSTEVDNRDVYADEGDEVVERVLGWIMKLFPGGPSKRRLSSHI